MTSSLHLLAVLRPLRIPLLVPLLRLPRIPPQVLLLRLLELLQILAQALLPLQMLGQRRLPAMVEIAEPVAELVRA